MSKNSYLFYFIYFWKTIAKTKWLKCNRSQGSNRKKVGKGKTDTIFNLISTQHNDTPISLNIYAMSKRKGRKARKMYPCLNSSSVDT